MLTETTTNIVCTLGPACDSATVLREMILSGMTIARFNLSHGSFDVHKERLSNLRAVCNDLNITVKTLLDLEGFRIRLGHLAAPFEIASDSQVELWRETASIPGSIPFDYPGDLRIITPGSEIFIDDGKILLAVTEAHEHRLICKVVVGGVVSSRKGVNIPGVKFPFCGLTEKDAAGVEYAKKHNFDIVAQSFVRSVEDVEVLRLALAGTASKLLAKIECQEAIDNIDEIIKVVDLIMIARGDMGVSIPIYQVPFVQKEIIKKCLRAQVPVITATQMLESMTGEIIPTRAEVSDVANAVLDGTNYVMLSAETAIGKYPVQTVRMMKNIIKYAEGYQPNPHSIPTI